MTYLPYIDVGRRFSEISDDEAKDPNSSDLELEWDWWRRRSGKSWEDLESRFRTVILAEAGSGKTREMQERCHHLVREKKFALFLPLERLEDEQLVDLLEEEELAAFERWLENSDETGWIYLDALDELKLREGYFGKALRSLRANLKGAEMRTRIVISCRPSDWQFIDLEEFKRIFPAPAAPSVPEKQEIDSEGVSIKNPEEERFLAPLKGRAGLNAEVVESNSSTQAGAEEKAEKLAVFRLLPLLREQAEALMRAGRPENVDTLISEVRRTDAWDFATTPQDIIELLAVWEVRGRLGTRTEQYEAHITTRLRERSDRPGQEQQLSDGNARLGAERLALSLYLSKTRTIRIPGGANEAKVTATGLDATALLSDWKPAHVKALLSLGVFDPSTFGRVRFHRRGVEEYLAACRLRNLAEIGIGSKKSLLRLLFKPKPQSADYVLPESLQPLAVWLAQWNTGVLHMVNTVLPGVLVSEGDSESFSPESRVAILRSIIECSLRGSHRTPSCSPIDLRRFATPELGQVIKESWPDALKSDDLLDFFLVLIREGNLQGFDTLLEAVARSADHRPVLRASALQALAKCEGGTKVLGIIDDFSASPTDWPDTMIAYTLGDLYPTFLSTADLIKIIRDSSKASARSRKDLQQALSAIVSKIEPDTKDSMQLRQELSRLIVGNQETGSAHYHASSEFSWASENLASLCLRQASNITSCELGSFLDSCFTANFFLDHHYYGEGELKALHLWIAESKIPKERIFVGELQFLLATFNVNREGGPLVSHKSFVRGMGDGDRDWLKRVAKDKSLDVRIRLSALLHLVRVWNAAERPPVMEQELRGIAQEEEGLAKLIYKWLEPPKPYPEEKEHHEIMRAQREKEEARLQGWLEWRRELLADPQKHFEGGELSRTRRLLFDWLMSDNSTGSTYQVWHKGAGIEVAFGAEIRKRARDAFSSYWRDVDCVPFSKKEDKNGGTPYAELYALTGLLAETESPGWAEALMPEDVGKACLLAMVEINGLPDFLNHLAESRGDLVSVALGRELEAQLGLCANSQHLPLLQDLTHASEVVQRTCLQPLQNFVRSWTEPKGEKAASGFSCFHLSQVLGILTERRSEIDSHELAEICGRQLEAAPLAKSSTHWLRALFALDSATATTALERAIKKLKPKFRKIQAVAWFGSVFDPYRALSMTLNNEELRPAILARLSRLAYRYIVPAEDQIRESGVAYTPDARDNAQHARSMLLNALIESSDPLSKTMISELAAEPEFESVRKFMIYGLSVREVKSTEPSPISIQGIHELEKGFEQRPFDRDTMFQVMANRLEDLQSDIADHDYFPRRTVQGIEQEDEMQRVVALLLDLASGSAYSVVREDEVADAKRTDIRLLSRESRDRVAIEIKILDNESNWTASDLVRALEAQLVGQYLRHENCKAGCLLLTYRGRKQYWQHPKTKKRLFFGDLLEFLRVRAAEIAQRNDGVRLGVFGLDLRDTVLAAAHKINR